MHKIITLLWQRRFGPLFMIQFGGALNDNVLRNAVVAMITFGILSETDNRALLVQVALGLFILPFVLFSASAGRFADDCPDRRLAIRVIKAVEIVTMLVALIGLYLGSTVMLLIAVCFAGTQSAYFGPFKYALLPELLKPGELIAGNGLLNASTYLAILLGIFWGTELGASKTSGLQISVILLSIAIIGFIFSFWFPKVPGKEISWGKSWSWNIFVDIGTNLKNLVMQQRQAALLIGFISWFWASGAIITAQLPVYIRDIAAADHRSYLLLLLIVCVGIAVGSLAAVLILQSKVTTKWVPAGMAVNALTLTALPLWPGAPLASEITELAIVSEFIQVGAAKQLCLMLAATSLCMGFYIVPLYATLQLCVPKETRGRIIAANNILNALFIVVAVLLAGVLIGLNESIYIAMRNLFYLLAAIGLTLAALAYKLLPSQAAVPQ